MHLLHGGRVGRGYSHSHVILQVDLGTSAEQRLHDRCVTILSSHVKWCPSMFVFRAIILCSINNVFHQFQIAQKCSNVKWAHLGSARLGKIDKKFFPTTFDKAFGQLDE